MIYGLDIKCETAPDFIKRHIVELIQCELFTCEPFTGEPFTSGCHDFLFKLYTMTHLTETIMLPGYSEES
jgi:hypothetical protein